ncbi:MAG: hypothetical protein PHI94_07400 [Eubacteriaceae bacterium]|nr:hypothetical protein [Eubacteriaceae bacterium]MDD4508557.1 hypothetical protein [Eubacteriaceae bacterium]
MDPSFWASAATVLTPFMFFCIYTLLILGCCALYILSSFGYYTMAQKRKIDYPWLCWIPLVRMYILGELISERIHFIKWTIPYVQVLLPSFVACTLLFGWIPVLGGLVCCVTIFLYLSAFYRLYQCYTSKHAVLFWILSVVIPVMFCIFPFILRKNKWRDPSRKPPES